MMTEFVTIQTNKFFCDCKPECVDSFKLPPPAADILMNDTGLILLVGGHKSERAGDVVKRGKGWKVCRVK